MNTVAIQAYDAFDRKFALAINVNNITPPCCAGCSACCSEPVYCDKREAELIVALIDKMPQEQRDRVEDMLADWVKRILPSRLLEQVQPSAFSYRKLRLPCPLLDTATGLCTVYEHRPLGCRSHVALKPRINCENDELRRTQKYIAGAVLGMPEAIGILLEDGGVLEMGHLSEFLAEAILGVTIKSADRQVARLQPDGRVVAEEPTKLKEAALAAQ